MKKVVDSFFNEIYVGETDSFDCKNYKLNKIKIVCILDNNCVRFTRSVNDKKVYCKEFSNTKSDKERCLELATKMYNKYLEM